MGFADAYIRGHQAGTQLKKQREDAELEKLMLEHKLRGMKIDEAIQRRQIEKQNFDLIHGQPANTIPSDVTSMGTVPTGTGFSVPVPNVQPKAQTIHGVPELGIGDTSIRPQSQEQMSSAAAAAKLQEMMLAARGKAMEPYNVSAGGTHVDPMAQTSFTAPKDEPTPSSPFAAVRQAQERELGRPLNSQELVSLSDKLDQNPTRAGLNELTAELRKLQVQELTQTLAGGRMTPQLFNQANKLADDFSAAPQVKDFITRRSGYQTILNAANDPSAAGDLSLIFAYMKTLDPNSVVREGEFATAQNAGSAFNRVGALYNKVVNGQRLTEAQRSDFVGQARKIYQGAKQTYSGFKQIFDSRAQAQGIDRKFVTYDMPDPAAQSATPGAVPGPVSSHGGPAAATPSAAQRAALAGASDGKHTLSDGSVWTVKGGVITPGGG